jgi:uncharacterized RDD family membrane protein YckC
VSTKAPPLPAFPEPPEESSACPTCGRDPGPGLACRFCGRLLELPYGTRLSSAWRRLGAYLLDTVFFTFAVVIDLLIAARGGLVTGVAFLAWLIWALVVWSRGQTPGKQLLGMRTIRLSAGRRASWGIMFVREFLLKFLLKFLLFGILVSITFGLGLITYFWLLWDARRQELWDKMVGTIVVDDRQGLLR